jgi:uncharacterized membrane protein
MFFMMMIMFFVVMRVMHGRRRHCAQLHYYRHPHFHRARPVVERPQPTAFERLKQGYVNGDLTDEQYEEQLDALLRSPETRKSVP